MIYRALKFAVSDIGRDRFSFSVLMIQIVVAALVLCYAIGMTIGGMETIKVIKKLDTANRIYRFDTRLNSEEMDHMASKRSAYDKLHLLSEFMDNVKGIESVTMDASESMPLDNKVVSKLKKEDQKACLRGGIYAADLIQVNNNFFPFFDISWKGMHGGKPKLNKNEILVGNHFKEAIKVGDKVRYVNTTYTVVGILPQRSFYVNPFEQDSLNYLDNSFVAKMQIRKGDTIGVMSKIMSTYLVQNDELGFKKIEQEMKRRRIDFLEKENFGDEVKESTTHIYNGIMTMLTIPIIILAFASVGLVASLLRFIRMYRYEFAINMAVGAGTLDIVMRIAIRIFIMYLVSSIAALAVWGFSFSTLLTFLVMALYFIASLIYPLICTRGIIEGIRRK